MATQREIDRELVRRIRQERRAAVGQLAATLGLEPRDVRSISVVDSKISVTLFANTEDGKSRAMALDHNGNRVPATYEIGLLMGEADLDEDAEIDKLIDPRGSFGQPLD